MNPLLFRNAVRVIWKEAAALQLVESAPASRAGTDATAKKLVRKEDTDSTAWKGKAFWLKGIQWTWENDDNDGQMIQWVIHWYFYDLANGRTDEQT